MSIKDDVKSVKNELNSEEKFIESFVKVERFYKKYKALIIGLSVIAVVSAIALGVKSNLDEKNKIAANIAFDKVVKNPNDKEALATLKDTNKKLYDVAMYLQSKKDGKNADVNVPYLKELAMYSKALEQKNVNELNNISMQNDFLLKEFAIFNKALILTNQGKYKEAKTALNLIPKSSKANELASLLRHYLLTK